MQTICIYSDHVAQQLENQICFNPKQTVQSWPSVHWAEGWRQQAVMSVIVPTFVRDIQHPPPACLLVFSGTQIRR